MSWLKFLIYLGCFVLGGYYFKKIMVGKDEGVQLQGASKSYEMEPKLEQMMKKEEEDSLAEVADEDL